MTERRAFILINDTVRSNALQAVRDADVMSLVSVMPGKRSGAQNNKLWALLSDVANSKPEGRQWTPETWKSAFLHAAGHQVRFAEGLDNTGPFPIGFHSSALSVKEMGDLITIILEYGDRNGVKWTEAEAGGWLDA